MTDTMLGGGLTYQIPEVLLQKSYDKSVDLFLFGLLAYELLTGVPAFPFHDDEAEQHDRITKCRFAFPGESNSEVSEPELSSDAKSLIKSLLLPEGRKRLTVSQIKQSTLFKKYIPNWKDVESGNLENEIRINFKDPSDEYAFDEVCYDSDDADFRHEYEMIDCANS